jgi:hypothetical protein
MNIEDLQSTAKTLIEAHAPLDGITVIADDGTWPQTPAREAALESDGLVIIIWQDTGGTPLDVVSRRGRLMLSVDLPITIEENRKVNLGVGGLNKDPGLVVREVLSCLCGFPLSDPFEPGDDPYSNIGDVGGINMRLINLKNKSTI